MAISNLSDFKIYDEEFQGGMIESLTQNAEVFNEASGGTIRMVTDDMLGFYKKEAFWKSIGSGGVSRQDVTSNAGLTDGKLEQAEHVSVKLFRKIDPRAVTYNAFAEIGGDADQDASFIIGKQVGERIALDAVNTSLAALRASLANVSAVTYDATGDVIKNIASTNMLEALRKMGDNSRKIKAWVMHSTQWFDLQEQGLADGYETIATGILNVHFVPAFGRPIIVTDSPSLINTTPNPDEYFVLGLQEDAAVVSKIGDVKFVSQLITGQEQLGIRFQGEYRYMLGLKGFSYDTANGGSNPADAAIATGSNWDKVVSSDYDLAGVVLKVLAK